MSCKAIPSYTTIYRNFIYIVGYLIIIRKIQGLNWFWRSFLLSVPLALACVAQTRNTNFTSIRYRVAIAVVVTAAITTYYRQLEQESRKVFILRREKTDVADRAKEGLLLFRLKDLKKLGSAPLISFMNRQSYKLLLGKKYRIYGSYTVDEIKVLPQVLVRLRPETQYSLA